MNRIAATRIAFATLGCRLNQFETDSLTGDFLRAGYEVVPFNSPADVYVINTCTITGRGEQKSRNLVNRALRHPGSRVVVTGCSVETEAEYYRALPEIDLVISNEKKHAILEMVEALLAGSIPLPDPGADVFGYRTADRTRRTRSMLKIQDGCNSFCSYCIVPYTRGRAVSRPAKEILKNAGELIASGFRELVVTGVNMSTYSCRETDFTGLIRSLLTLEGDFRLRIASVEPEKMDSSLADLFEDPKLCRHLHLCLQSGSESVLRRMNRDYTAAAYMDIVRNIRSRYPDFNFTTDIIVGFPGETDENFKETLEIVREAAFSHVHTFQYSPRKGTRAADFPDQIPAAVKQERSAMLRELAEQQKKAYRQSLLGVPQTVLIERFTQDGTARGYSGHYVPFRISGLSDGTNRFITVIPETLDPLTMDLQAAADAGSS